MRKIYFLYILILNILFFNKLRQIIPEIRSERRDLLIFIFILKTTGTFTPVHSTLYCVMSLGPHRKSPGRIYKCHFTSGRQDSDRILECVTIFVTRIIQSLYYTPASRCINAWMHSLKKSVKPEIVNRYDLWVLRHRIGGAKVFVNNVQWSDQMM